MAKEILSQAYFQANMIKGFRYFDDAGKIMNKWESDFPNKEVGLQGLLMSNPEATFRQLRVDTQRIWMHFFRPDTIRSLLPLASNVTRDICDILSVDRFARLGVRVEYVFEYPDFGQALDDLAGFLLSENWANAVKGSQARHHLEIVMPAGTSDLPVNLRIAAVKKAPEVKDLKDLPECGLLVDADVYRSATQYLDDLKRFTNQAQEWLEEELPNIVRTLFKGGNHG